MRPANFDRVARIYRWLELLTFGRALERARFVHLEVLHDAQDILLLGDGDGRALGRLLGIAPTARIVSVDASPRMIELASSRVPDADRGRVKFVCGDARVLNLPDESLDAVVTQFFLDCFTAPDVHSIVRSIAPAVRPGGVWLFADFVLPPAGLRRLVARAVTGGLYAFFRWQTGLAARLLPPSEQAISDAGIAPSASASFALGMVHSVIFRKESAVSGTRSGEELEPEFPADAQPSTGGRSS
jgi:ubiquinone/menaquinone biosynthesis C-methylase UbiE